MASRTTSWFPVQIAVDGPAWASTRWCATCSSPGRVRHRSWSAPRCLADGSVAERGARPPTTISSRPVQAEASPLRSPSGNGASVRHVRVAGEYPNTSVPPSPSQHPAGPVRYSRPVQTSYLPISRGAAGSSCHASGNITRVVVVDDRLDVDVEPCCFAVLSPPLPQAAKLSAPTSATRSIHCAVVQSSHASNVALQVATHSAGSPITPGQRVPADRMSHADR